MKRRFVGAGLAALVLSVALGLVATAAQAQESTSYTVTIENLTSGQPFTPPVVVAHTNGADVFEPGDAASSELSQIAENGNNEPLMMLLGGSDAVIDMTVGDAPIMPGASASLSVEASEGDLLSAVFMLICTNDGFSGVDSLALPASGSETVDANAYDAGSEQNTEDFADMVPPCQELVGVTSDDAGTGESNPDLAEGGVVMMHAGIQGDADLTVEDHGWTDPVARITVSAEAATDGLPSAGTGPSDGGTPFAWIIAATAAGAMLIVGGGALAVRSRRRP